MNDYAFVFRRTRALSPDELGPRNQAARAWALARGDEGVLRAAAPLAEEGAVVAADSTAPTDGTIVSVLVIAAEDLDAALALAREHPGLGYGTTIEVRPVRAAVPR